MLEELVKKCKIHLLTYKTVIVLLGMILIILMAFLAGFKLATNPKTEKEALLPIVSGQSASKVDRKESVTGPNTTSNHQKSSSEKVLVDIKGAVKNEGVYELITGSRLTDVVKLAGGFTEQADRKSVNLAQKVNDEEVIYVATIDESVDVVVGSSRIGNGVNSSTPSSTSGKTNINSATIEDLQTISGIGEKRARDIIAYREINGGFNSVDDLKNVSGIGDKILEKLKSDVTVD